MVVVASGTSTQVKCWGRLLRAASISFVVEKSYHQDESARRDYTELWVGQEDADEARSAIRNNQSTRSLLW